MAHEVETMMYRGKTPWHGLGVPIPGGQHISIQEAIKLAGFGWNVELRHLYADNPGGEKIGVRDSFAVCRSTDNSILGIVGPDYRPLQTVEAFQWFQPFFSEGLATIETAGSLKGGRKVWVLARVKDSLLAVRGDDMVNNYILLSNSHDGTTPVKVGFTPIRVVCNNTLCLAHESKASRLLSVKHTANLHINLRNIREIMDVAGKEFRATVRQYNALAAKGISSRELYMYVQKVFGFRKNDGKKIIPKVIELFENGHGHRMAGSTYWGAYNAVNEYLNYFRGRSRDSALDTLWYGNGVLVNRRALNTAIKMARAA